MKLTESQRRKVIRTGQLEVPREISWRSANQHVKAGRATLTLFYKRWCAILTFDEAGRRDLQGSR